ncbi:hypothetical protein BH09MYX1_BH09MYX1_36120 [soil metagenome]
MQRFRRLVLRALPLLPLALVFVPTIAQAAIGLRPGGGDSYSGSSSSGSSGSGGGDSGDAGAIIDLIILCIAYPQIGVPLLIIIGIIFIVSKVRKSKQSSWSVGAPNRGGGYVPPRGPQPIAATTGVARSSLDVLRRTDEDYSTVLFEDFLYTLYGHAQNARPNVGALAAYIAPAAQPKVAGDVSAANGVVIGAIRFIRLNQTPQSTVVVVDFEANLNEVRQGQTHRFYVVDRWTLQRSATAKSRPPARSRTLDCPNCGAPLQSLRGDQCTYCKQHVGWGKFDWTVVDATRLKSEARPPAITASVEEQGNQLPTVVDPYARQRYAELQRGDAQLDWNALVLRVRLIHAELQVAWSNRDWPRARPYVTDNLFQSQQYFMDTFIQQRARNVTENARILHVDLSNVLVDKYFDAITLRVFATGLDYTVSDDGRLLSGSKSKERPYTEYWTIIRGVGRRGQKITTTPTCPSCGAPLKITMAGACEYCKAKVTAGEFDWVLSRIEQDDSYSG